MQVYNECPMIENVKSRIVDLFSPNKIILFHKKTNLKGVTSSFKLCVIVDEQEKYQLEKDIYLKVDCDVPFDVIVYTSAEWEELLEIETSFAHRVAEMGCVIYG